MKELTLMNTSVDSMRVLLLKVGSNKEIVDDVSRTKSSEEFAALFETRQHVVES